MPRDLLNMLGRRAVLAATLIAPALGFAGCTQAPTPRYVVFFTGWSAELDPAARGVVAEAAAAAKVTPGPVVVEGFADTTVGPAQANAEISRARAERVNEELVRNGIPQTRISARSRRDPGADPGVESRRVEIRIGS